MRGEVVPSGESVMGFQRVHRKRCRRPGGCRLAEPGGRSFSGGALCGRWPDSVCRLSVRRGRRGAEAGAQLYGVAGGVEHVGCPGGVFVLPGVSQVERESDPRAAQGGLEDEARAAQDLLGEGIAGALYLDLAATPPGDADRLRAGRHVHRPTEQVTGGSWRRGPGRGRLMVSVLVLRLRAWPGALVKAQVGRVVSGLSSACFSVRVREPGRWAARTEPGAAKCRCRSACWRPLRRKSV